MIWIFWFTVAAILVEVLLLFSIKAAGVINVKTENLAKGMFPIIFGADIVFVILGLYNPFTIIPNIIAAIALGMVFGGVGVSHAIAEKEAKR